jgi:hypothetical protein
MRDMFRLIPSLQNEADRSRIETRTALENVAFTE